MFVIRLKFGDLNNSFDGMPGLAPRMDVYPEGDATFK